MTAETDEQTRIFLKALGVHLREAREAADVRQAHLARTIGMDPTNLAKHERGERNITIDTLVRIAHGLGLKLSVRLLKPTQPGRKRAGRRKA